MKKDSEHDLLTTIAADCGKQLVSLSMDEVSKLLGQAYNDYNSNIWRYKLPHKTFWSKKYLYLTFKDKKVIDCEFVRWRKYKKYGL
ncbi:hypothetical protein [Winogradskyella sp.]|uniref:hypothetical protein n=1 Tax=Winogradskyella sp. TaxID=1883156 RepID=UPI00261C3C86|nr:hypothetical protein [Winogradskyella sp.]